MTDVVVCTSAFAMVALWYAGACSRANAFGSLDRKNHLEAAHVRSYVPPIQTPASDVVDWREHFTIVCEILTVAPADSIEAIRVIGRLGEQPDHARTVTRLARHLAWEYCLSSTVTMDDFVCTVRFSRPTTVSLNAPSEQVFPGTIVTTTAHREYGAVPTRIAPSERAE